MSDEERLTAALNATAGIPTEALVAAARHEKPHERLEALVRSANKVINQQEVEANRKAYQVLDQSGCDHPAESIAEGPRVPLRYGSGPTEVCSKCGYYRINLHGHGYWQPGPPDTEDRDED